MQDDLFNEETILWNAMNLLVFLLCVSVDGDYNVCPSKAKFHSMPNWHLLQRKRTSMDRCQNGSLVYRGGSRGTNAPSDMNAGVAQPSTSPGPPQLCCSEGFTQPRLPPRTRVSFLVVRMPSIWKWHFRPLEGILKAGKLHTASLVLRISLGGGSSRFGVGEPLEVCPSAPGVPGMPLK